MTKYWVELAADYGGWHEAETHAQAARQVFDMIYGEGTDLAKTPCTCTMDERDDYSDFHYWSVHDCGGDHIDDIFVWTEEEQQEREERFNASGRTTIISYRA